jgi:hypothetical protein
LSPALTLTTRSSSWSVKWWSLLSCWTHSGKLINNLVETCLKDWAWVNWLQINKCQCSTNMTGWDQFHIRAQCFAKCSERPNTGYPKTGHIQKPDKFVFSF